MRSKSYYLVIIAFLTALLSHGGVLATEHGYWQDRPIWLGTSGGNINDIGTLYCCAGTLGALVQDSSGNLYILSNNHVLAKTNAGQFGDPIIQPGLIDRGCAFYPDDAVAAHPRADSMI